MKFFRKLHLFLIVIFSICFVSCFGFDAEKSHFTRLLITDDEIEITGIPPEMQAYYESKPNAEELLAYYTKYIDAGGVAIVGNRYVEDGQFYTAREIVLLMTSKHPELREQLTFRKEYSFRVVIVNTDEPVDSEFNSEYGISIGANTIPERPNHWKRGFCAYNLCMASVAWDAVYPPNRDGEIDMLLVTFLHEFAHALHYAIEELDPTFNDRLQAAYEHAKEPHNPGEPPNSIWNNGSDPDDESFNRAYALTNPQEYWADTVASWFYDPPSFTDSVYKIFEYDALILPLVEEWLPKIYLRPLDTLERPREWDWGERPE